jgi:hypothetical protein
MSTSFPVLNSSAKIVNEKRQSTKEFINYLSVLHLALTDFLSFSGIKIPLVTTTQATQIALDGAKVGARIVYNTDLNVYQGLINNGNNTYTFKTFSMIP